MTPPKKKPKGKPGRRRTYTQKQREKVLRVLRSKGLSAAAKVLPCTKDTVLRWAREAGIDPNEFSDRSTIQNQRAAKASVASRKAAMVEKRAQLSDAIMDRLTMDTVELLANRIQEEREREEVLKNDEARLATAVLALEASTLEEDPKDPLSPTERKVLERARTRARADIVDAKLILEAHRASRIRVPDLVHLLSNAVAEHLQLEGEAAEAAGLTDVTVVFTAPRPARTPVEVVQLQEEMNA